MWPPLMSGTQKRVGINTFRARILSLCMLDFHNNRSECRTNRGLTNGGKSFDPLKRGPQKTRSPYTVPPVFLRL